ncbi:MAG: sialate O-acetylesterase [Chitinophagaceae bacterium]
MPLHTMKLKTSTVGIIGFFILSCHLPSSAQMPITLPDILSDHAVLERNSNINLWGKGPAGKELKIVASWNSHDTVRLVIPVTGMWNVPISTPSEGGPYQILFKTDNETKTISDIQTGDVWLCSGQSNMEFNMRWGIDTVSGKYHVKPNPKIRFFQVDRNYDYIPVSNVKGKWIVCDANTVQDFSTVGYFTGRKIQEKTNLPIGLIGSYWGGTNIQAWMPASCFDRPELDPTLMHMDAYDGCPRGYSILYNAMIYPLFNYTIKGCVWYQGETNVDYDWMRYGKLLSSMIAAWRFGMNNNFPFYTIQIASWNGYKGRHAAYLREQEAQLVHTVPNYGTISILDLTDDTTNIHPKVKMEVGERMADLILQDIYHQPTVKALAPTIVGTIFYDGSAEAQYVSSSELHMKGNEIYCFEIAGSDSSFHKAKAVLEKGKKIKIFSKDVRTPKYVRYCFQNTSIPNLFDDAGLPLNPYRSDSFIDR